MHRESVFDLHRNLPGICADQGDGPESHSATSMPIPGAPELYVALRVPEVAPSVVEQHDVSVKNVVLRHIFASRLPVFQCDHIARFQD